jgi:hypothetical protein
VARDGAFCDGGGSMESPTGPLPPHGRHHIPFWCHQLYLKKISDSVFKNTKTFRVAKRQTALSVVKEISNFRHEPVDEMKKLLRKLNFKSKHNNLQDQVSRGKLFRN